MEETIYTTAATPLVLITREDLMKESVGNLKEYHYKVFATQEDLDNWDATEEYMNEK